MKTFLALVLLLISGCSSFESLKHGCTLSYPHKLPQSLEVHKMSDQIFYVKDTSFYDTNVMVVKLKSGGVLVVSSHIDTVKNNEMLNWIKSELKPQKMIALNTHFHNDGTGGNEAFRNSKVEIWSSHKTHSLYKSRAESMQAGLATMIVDKNHKNNVLARKNEFATHFFDLGNQPSWDISEKEVKVVYPGPAHSEDNLAVYLPDQKILFGGCMVRALEFDIGNTKDANLQTYASSLLNLQKLKAKTIIPGHGKIGGSDLLDHSLKLVREK